MAVLSVEDIQGMGLSAQQLRQAGIVPGMEREEVVQLLRASGITPDVPAAGGNRFVDTISSLGKSASDALGGFGKIPITPFPTAMAPTLGQHIEFAANIPRSIQDFAGATSDLIRGVEDPQTGLTPLGTMREGLEGFAPAVGRQMVRGLEGLGFPEREMPPPTWENK